MTDGMGATPPTDQLMYPHNNKFRRGGFGWLLGACSLMALAACDDGASPACTVNADCASGICGSDGVCGGTDAGSIDGGIRTRFGDASGPTQGDGGAAADMGAVDAAVVGQDSGPADTAGGGATDAGGGACKPNHDGTISAGEAPYGPGLKAKYRVANQVSVDSAGQVQPDGSRIWSFDGALQGDHDLTVATLDVSGSWFIKHFPGATYAAKMTETEPLLGVFELTTKALLLRGVVSPEDGLLATRLSYDPPVEILAFPLSEGSKWTRTTQITGFAQGILAAYGETYTSSVDGHGIAKTPFGNFPVLRVSTEMVRQIGLLKSSLRTRLFAAECFGTVVSLRSKSDESAVDFTAAAELRRLTP